jgi:hypothetical protein
MEALQAAVDANLGRLAFGWKGLDAVSPGICTRVHMHTNLLQKYKGTLRLPAEANLHTKAVLPDYTS